MKIRLSRVLVIITAAIMLSITVGITVSCDETSTNGNNGRCSTAKPMPLSLTRVIDKLKASGYHVKLAPNECAAPETVMVLSLKPKTDDKATALCYVDKRPLYGNGFIHLTVGTWVNRNVTCAIIPSKKSYTQADYQQLKRATKRLNK